MSFLEPEYSCEGEGGRIGEFPTTARASPSPSLFFKSLSSPGKKEALIPVLEQHSNLRDGFLASSPLHAGDAAPTAPVPGQ